MNVYELLDACKEQIDKGNGDKYIYISQDDEGNSFHQLLYLFTDDEETVDSYGLNPDDTVLLG